MTQGSNTEKGQSVRLAGRLWTVFIRPYWPRILLAFGFGLLVSAANAGFTWITGWVFAAFDSDTTWSPAPTARQVMIWGPVAILLTGFSLAGFRYLFSITIQGTAINILRDLQNAMYSSFLRYDYAQTREDGTGQLVSRFTNDVTILRESLTRGNTVLLDAMNLIALIAAMIWYDWVLFLVIFLIYPTIGYPVMLLGKILRRTAQKVQEQIGEITSRLTESLKGARLVKTYRLEAREEARAHDLFEERRALLDKLVRVRSANDPVITAIGAIAVAVVIGVAALRVSLGLLDGPTLISFIVALTLLSQPARSLGTLNAVIQEGLAATERIFWVLDRAPVINEAAAAPALQLKQPEAGAHILFENVRFSYADGTEALAGVDLHVKPGQTVALVGESGAGKSTILTLLPRLYEPSAGRILIDGQDISELQLSSLRDALAYVDQEAVLFDETIATNIGFGDLSADRTRIEEAARLAAADEFIRALQGGYDAPAGEGGGNLSGGQRQRISLARAFLKNAPVLLLDEATSALDSESEAKVQEALARLRQGRTTLVIAHRLSTVREADLICVMDKGRIVEQGRHEELVARGGLYARLAALQFAEE